MTQVPPRVVIYGGSFDPPHQGHVDCLTEASRSFPQSQFLVIPGYQPAGAEGQHKNPAACYEDRVAMARAAFEGGDCAATVSTLESQLPCPNFTYKTVENLLTAYPGQRLGVMMGLDQFKVFHRWAEPLKILASADIVVVRRDSKESIVKVSEQVMDALGFKLIWERDHKAAKLTGSLESRVFVVDAKTALAASSEIKFRLAKGKSLPAGWLPDKVKKIIEVKDLYKGEDS